MKKVLTLLAFSLVLNGCGDRDNGGGNANGQAYEAVSKARKSFGTSYVQCPTGDCPQSVAGLYIFIEKSATETMKVCSGTLIANNQILTNAHCLFPKIQKAGASCESAISVVFPETKGAPAERFYCDKIVKLSADNEKNDMEPDWAIIQFKGQTARTPAKMNFKGVALDHSVTMYKVDFDASLDRASVGTFKPTNCEANSNHFFNDMHIGPYSALFNVSHCTNELINGNSGSGIFNKNGELVGVFSTSYNSDVEDGYYKKKYPTLYDNVGGGTNLACLPINGNRPNPLCYFKKQQYYAAADNFVNLRMQHKDSSFQEAGLLLDGFYQKSRGPVMFESVSSSLLRNFDYAFPGEFAVTSRYVADSYVATKFPYLPSCVKPNSKNKFQVQIMIRDVVGGRVVDKDTHLATKKSTVRILPYDFEKVDADTYVMTTKERPFSKGNSKKLFSISNFGETEYLVPICD